MDAFKGCSNFADNKDSFDTFHKLLFNLLTRPIMRPPKKGSLADKAITGAVGATAGMTTGSMLTAVGATGLGGAITTASATAVGTAATALSSLPLVGGAAASGITAVASGAAVVGTAIGGAVVAAAPFALIGAAGYGVYRLFKWLGE